MNFSEKFVLANAQEGETCLELVVEGTGVLDPAAVAEAVATAGRATRLARLVRGKGRRWVDGGRVPVVRVLDGDLFDRETLSGLPELHRPLGSGRDRPTSEVVVLTGARPALVFRVEHLVTDGTGVRLWAEQVFRALRGEEPQYLDDTANEIDLRREHSAFTARPKPDGPEVSTLPPLRAPARFGTHPQFQLRRAVNGHHPAVSAKLAVALVGLCGLDHALVSVTVDLRRHLPDVRTTDCMSFAVMLEVRRGETWQQAHEKLLRMLAENQDVTSLPPVPVLRAVLAMPPRLLRALSSVADGRIAKGKGGGVPVPFVLSHLGRLDPAAFSFEGFAVDTVYSMPMRARIAPPGITVVETNGRTEIVVSGDDVPELRARARELLDGLEAALTPAGSVLRGKDVPLPQGTLVSAFRERVAESPDAVALVGTGEPVTYAELDARSTAVANALVARGVRGGDVVGLLSGRSVGAVAGIWGVLKAGAAYLPLDTRSPDAWVRDLLADAGASVCLVDRGQVGRECLPDGCAAVVVDNLPATPGATAPEVTAEPEDLAYVIYTSGSTGRPKGVEIGHAAALAYCRYAVDAYGIDATSCFPLFTSPAFDLPITALLPPLLAGGRVALIEDEPNHRSLAAMLSDHGVNSVKLTPSHLDLIARLGLTCPDVRVAVVGGEGLPVRVAEAARAAFGPRCRVVNEYGPTEFTVGCVVHTYDPETDTDPDVPIGLPVDNTTVHLLDDLRAPVPAGEVGEIYLSGPQLARGYRGRPDLDRDAFVTLADGARAYRTGDLARVLPSGELDYLGRRDDQVKVLGHRVEPSEIVRALEEHPAVRRALVVAKARPGSSTKLACAYVVAHEPVTRKDLTAHVAALLPAHLVPSAVVFVDDLPRTANGKVDPRALPDPFATTAHVPAAEDAGRDEVADAVAGIWATVLGVHPREIAEDSDFGLLGGTSITFLSMIGEVCSTLLDAEQERRFMAGFDRVVGRPTPGNVAEAARDAMGVAVGGR
ncbi:non-ribosomal peptide synthetase [Umezawaea tangerina]|uniref:Amino acid adenylation domain-containing protein n=1 Tax=Umezawaea tangerina TaxID=84725 RepID=A0A2T0T7W3_9PSEU|nr:non-ribosomal peptide synthetase [Umezawaea tangerina]PRY41752.1 amino acid adenylation domain-containing protein [Umezawaea tangerina]